MDNNSTNPQSNRSQWTTAEEQLLKQYMNEFSEFKDYEIADLLIKDTNINRTDDAIKTRMSIIRNRLKEEKKEERTHIESEKAQVLIINAATSLLDALPSEARKEILSKYISF